MNNAKAAKTRRGDGMKAAEEEDAEEDGGKLDFSKATFMSVRRTSGVIAQIPEVDDVDSGSKSRRSSPLTSCRNIGQGVISSLPEM